MMKRFITFMLAMVTITAMAQTGIENHSVSLADGETWEMPDFRNFFENKENELAAQYANNITSSVLFRTINGEDKNGSAKEVIEYAIQDIKTNDIPRPWWYPREVAYKLASSASFRTYLADQVNSMLQAICRIYPASTKQIVLNLIDRVTNFIDDMSKHTYKLAEIKHTYDDGDVYIEKVLQKDGRVLDSENEEDWRIINSTEGWIARRVVLNNFSLKEMKGYLLAARKAVAGVDVSKQPMYVATYTINKNLKVFVATDGEICQFKNGKQVKNIGTITYMKDASGSYYKVLGKYEFDWEIGKRIANCDLFDTNGNLIYSEKVEQ